MGDLLHSSVDQLPIETAVGIRSIAQSSQLRASRKIFYTLDLLRGFAAIMVMLLHMGLLPNGLSVYLAVDLFFLLSGVVVVEAYEKRLKDGWSVERFMLVRIVRLWPMYIVGALIAIIAICCASIDGADIGVPGYYLHECIRIVFFVPHVRPSLSNAFELNPPAWSLLCELIVNLAFGVLCRATSTRAWLVVTATLALALYLSAGHLAGTNAGIDRGVLAGQLWFGVLRAAFAFSAGILIHRAWRAGYLPEWKVPASVPVLFMGAIMIFTRSDASHVIRYGMLDVVILIPAVVALAMTIRPHGWVRKISAIFGRISYPIYAIHAPAIMLVASFFGSMHATPAWVLGAEAALIAATALPLDRFVDRPIRNYLTAKFGLTREDVVATPAL